MGNARKTEAEEVKELLVTAAEYERDGHLLKATALYKAVVRLRPELTDIQLRLGELHATFGLLEEACGHLLLARKALLREGRGAEATEVRKRMGELGWIDPTQPGAKA